MMISITFNTTTNSFIVTDSEGDYELERKVTEQVAKMIAAIVEQDTGESLGYEIQMITDHEDED